MSWYCVSKAECKNVKEFIEKEIFKRGQPKHWKLVPHPDDDPKEQVLYSIIHDGGGSIITVDLISIGFNGYCVKTFGDYMGPAVANCPIEILDAAGSGVPSFFSEELKLATINWRNKCLNNVIHNGTHKRHR